MTKKKILIFYDETQQNNITHFINNIDYKLYDVDLITEETNKLNKDIIKKATIIKYNKNIFKKTIFKITFILKNKNKYELSYLFSSDNLFANSLIRIKAKSKILFVRSNILNEYNYREYFIKRHIYDFNKIVFKTYEEEKMFLKYYPTLSKKTSVISDFIDYKTIERLSKEEIEEKIKKTDKTILMITELNEEKNKLLNTLKLIKEIKTEIKNIKLYIIGDGIDKYAYQSFIEDNKLEDTIYLLGKKENVNTYIDKCKYIIINNKEDLDKYLYPSIILNTQIISKCRYKDDTISVGKNYGYLLTNTKNIKEEITEILNKKHQKKEKFDFEKINKEKSIYLYHFV